MLTLNLRVETIDGIYQANAQSDTGGGRIAAVHKGLEARFNRQVKKSLCVLLSAFLLSGLQVRAEEPPAMKVIEVAPGVFVRQGVHGLMTAENGGGIANVGFVVGGSAVAVIDTGGSFREGETLLAAIRNETDLPVRWVINTHVHPDHVFGNAAFLGPDVAFVGHERLGPALTARFDHYVAGNRVAMGDDALAGTERVTPDTVVSDTMTIDLGDRRLQLRAWPVAHTDSDLTVLDEKTGTLFTGDLVFLEHLPSLDGSLRGWQSVIPELAKIPAETVIPGHGPLDADWPAALEPQRRYFDTLAADIETAIEAGVPMSEAVKSAGRSEAARWELFDEFNTRNATTAFAELEWE